MTIFDYSVFGDLSLFDVQLSARIDFDSSGRDGPLYDGIGCTFCFFSFFFDDIGPLFCCVQSRCRCSTLVVVDGQLPSNKKCCQFAEFRIRSGAEGTILWLRLSVGGCCRNREMMVES